MEENKEMYINFYNKVTGEYISPLKSMDMNPYSLDNSSFLYLGIHPYSNLLNQSACARSYINLWM